MQRLSDGATDAIAFLIAALMLLWASTACSAEPIKPVSGLTVPVTVVRIVDGDTLVAKTPSMAFEWHVRLINTWSPEMKEKGGPEAKAWVEAYVKKHSRDETLLHIPMPPKFKANPLALVTMERLPGFIWIGDELLNAEIVKAGHATKTKKVTP